VKKGVSCPRKLAINQTIKSLLYYLSEEVDERISEKENFFKLFLVMKSQLHFQNIDLVFFGKTTSIISLIKVINLHFTPKVSDGFVEDLVKSKL